MEIGADHWLKPDIAKGYRSQADLEDNQNTRGVNGFGYYDWINSGDYLMSVTAAILRKFVESGTGYPGGTSEEAWNTALTKAADQLEAYLKADRDGDLTGQDSELYAGVKEALRWVADNIFDLWD